MAKGSPLTLTGGGAGFKVKHISHGGGLPLEPSPLVSSVSGLSLRDITRRRHYKPPRPRFALRLCVAYRRSYETGTGAKGVTLQNGASRG